jgi:hypothetical protein
MRRCSALPARLLALLLTLAAVSGPLKTAAQDTPLLQLVGAHTNVTGEPELRISSPAPVLWPGHRAGLAVSVASSAGSSDPVRLVSLTVAVGAASPACGSENVTATSYRWTPGTTEYTVGPGQTVVVPLSVTMVETGRNQDACQGAAFPLRFSATTEPIS